MSGLARYLGPCWIILGTWLVILPYRTSDLLCGFLCVCVGLAMMF